MLRSRVLAAGLLGLSLLAGAALAGQSMPAAGSASPDAASETPAPAVRENPATTLHENAERGWFFYEHPKQPPPPADLPPVVPTVTPPPPPKEERCKKKETWSEDCGFVDPGTDFDFQAKERDALLHRMSMSRNDPKAVEDFQYYNKWVLDRSIEVANLWYYNTVQNPELDANVKAPINTFGLKLMTEVKDSSQQSILGALRREGAFLVYFSRHDCHFCSAMAPVLTEVSKSTGLEIWNAALDKTCMPGFENHCLAGEAVQQPASILQVSIVPTLFLYVPGNTWIRIATGVTDAATLTDRTTTFFSAYRTALLKGVHNAQAGRAPVDFSDGSPSGTASGVTPASTPRAPTGAEIQALLKKP